jgi:glycosyltransferase involved in cell wall biosynthesis
MTSSGLTILTTSLPGCAGHLRETADSIARAKSFIPATINWVLVIDGPGEVPDISDVIETRVIRLDRHTGLPSARNVGLGAVTTEWVMPLDHDDLLDSDGLLAMWSAIAKTDHYWVAGNVALVGGGVSPHFASKPKTFARHQLEAEWTMPFIFYPNAVVVKTHAALAVGGWPALEAAEDLGFVLALNASWDGAFLPHTILQYRVWEQQTSQSIGYKTRKTRAFEALMLMVNARRASRGMQPIAGPDVQSSYETSRLPSYWRNALAAVDEP